MEARQEPTRIVCPGRASTDAADCVAVMAAGGVTPLPWQASLLEPWLGRTDSGLWSSPVVGLSVPRQNGKTIGLVGGRIHYGMLVLGETVIYTSQLQKTSTETFEELKAFYESPAISRHVAGVKTALGREEIRLRNGGRIKFLARTRNGGNGQHGDLLVFDEAQYLDDRAQQSFLPAISARSNPQTLYVGTPPDDETQGDVFRSVRDRALAGESRRTCWAEWSVDEVGDPMDEARWWRANPSLGTLISVETVRAEAEQVRDPRAFAIDRLGWWRPAEEAVDPAFDAAQWDALEVPAGEAPPESAGRLAYGVKFSPDGRTCAVSAAIAPRKGPAYVELVDVGDTSGGIEPTARWLAERRGRASVVVVDGRTGMDTLVDRAVGLGLPRRAVVRCGSREAVAAATRLMDEVGAGTVTHIASPALDDSVKGCVRRRIGSSGTGLGDGPQASSIAAESAALALWGARTTRRDPKRKGGISWT